MKISYVFLTLAVFLGYSSLALAQSPLLIPGHDFSIRKENQATWKYHEDQKFPVSFGHSYHCRGIGADENNIFYLEPEFTGNSFLRHISASPADQRYDNSAFSIINLDIQPVYNFSIINYFGSNSSHIVGSIKCEETTLYGSFNTVRSANPVNFLELSNIDILDSAAAVLYVSVSGYDGKLLNTIKIDLSAGERKDIAVHDLPGASDTFGTIKVSHDSSPGSIRASLSKYVYSADNQLRLVQSEQLKVR